MNKSGPIKEQVSGNGFAVVENIFSDEEIKDILAVIANTDSSRPSFRKSVDLFAIRQFFKEVKSVAGLVFNAKLVDLIRGLFGEDFFVVKSIYFDKPENSNWFVSYHQDLTVSVNSKADVDGYGPWTVKQSQYAVQPPLQILEDNFTIRIHLDTTTAENGALKVIPRSHVKGIYRPDAINWMEEKETVCDVERGGVMVMKPLLLHSSGRTMNRGKRRVIHIEFSRSMLAQPLAWAEKMNIPILANA